MRWMRSHGLTDIVSPKTKCETWKAQWFMRVKKQSMPKSSPEAEAGLRHEPASPTNDSEAARISSTSSGEAASQ